MPEVTKICHGLTIGDLKFGNARPGVVEATLKPGETMEQALDELDERLTAWHKKRYPHLYENQPSPIPERPFAYRQEQTPVIDKSTEKLEIAIDNADTIEKLQMIKDQCGLAGIMGQWISKFNQLNLK
jgi:hypothetical protein